MYGDILTFLRALSQSEDCFLLCDVVGERMILCSSPPDLYTSSKLIHLGLLPERFFLPPSTSSPVVAAAAANLASVNNVCYD